MSPVGRQTWDCRVFLPLKLARDSGTSENNHPLWGSQALKKGSGFPPDTFDIRVLNGLAERGDIFALPYLKNFLGGNRLLTRFFFLTGRDLTFKLCLNIKQSS